MHPLNCESIQEVLHQRIISPVVALADMTKEPSCIETNTDKSAAIDVHATVSGADDSFVEERHPLDESIDDSADIASGLAPKVSIAVSPIPGNFSPNSRLGSPIATSQSGATGGVNVFRQTLEQLLSLFIVAPDSDEQMRRRHLVSMLPLPLSDYSGVAVLVLRMYRVIFESLASETTFNAKVENPNQNSSSNDMKLQQSLQLLAGIHAFPSNSAYIPSTLTNKMSPRSPIRDPFSHDTFHHDHLTLKDLDEVRRVITSQLVNPQSVLSQNKVKDTFKSHVNFLLYSPVASTMTYLEVVHSLCAISKCAYYCCFESARTNDRNSLTPTNSRRLSREIKNESISRDRSASVTINDTSLTLLKSCLEQVEATKNALVSSLLAYHPSESDISSVEALDTWQEEVHRLVDHSWSHLAQTNSGDLNLLVSLAPSMRDRFDHFPLFCESASLPSLPLSLFYRSLVQRFILVRSLHRFVAKLLACAEGGDLVGTSIDDITIGLIDDNLLPFAGQISIPSELRVGAAINMKGKKFLEAATYLPVTPDVVPVAPARKESTTSKLQDRAYSAFGLLRASPSKGKLSKSPAPSANVTPVANLTKKLTEVLLVQDSIAFLLVRIIKGTEYEVLMSVPISQIRGSCLISIYSSRFFIFNFIIFTFICRCD